MDMIVQAGLASQQIPDADLIKKVLEGEKSLFGIIMRRYNQRLFRIGMSILKNAAEVEDAMQCAYISAYEHLAQFEYRSSFITWLMRILINQCYQQKNRKQVVSTNGEETVNLKNVNTPAAILANKEMNSVLEQAIAQLPEKYRLVFVLREIEDLSVKETSEALNIQETNVKVRMNRAKAMLRENLNGYLKENVYNFHLTRCDRIVSRVMAHLQIEQ